MKVLIDTNVILDVLCKRPKFFEDSTKILKLCEVKKIMGVISVLSVPNIIYIMRKELNKEKIQQVIDTISLICFVSDLTMEDLKIAAGIDFADYEDAVQSVCAVRNNCEYILTRNKKDFANSKVPAISPSEFLDLNFKKDCV